MPMIGGVVNSRFEAGVQIRVRGPHAAELEVDAIVDTGFTASLTLPAEAVTALGLTRQSGGSVEITLVSSRESAVAQKRLQI